eukprot:CAMPEP_0194027348 /NCGR_PEP_ID=MMETSP0009_2-20130614/1510_1 /TAXON_ID=210454 /ORGANISM="Grammatophora oceanica, Strain CCMP 410" /LENGTH=357 /DNA_ID=CAMNT_0038666389 /DNA_START=74 /DNA_END=1147 /DNA_ORIENTATION=-
MSNHSGDVRRELLARQLALRRASAVESGAASANRSSLLHSALLREASVQNILGGPNAALVGPSVEEEAAALAANPVLLANALAQERQRKLAAARQNLVTDAYQRGREEAIMSLMQSGALRNSSLFGGIGSSFGVASTARPGPVTQLLPSVESPTVVALAEAAHREKQTKEQSALASLGASSLHRRNGKEPYFDASSLSDPDPIALAGRRTRGGVTEPFPEKLHRLLREVDEAGEAEIVSFFAHGRAFAVHNPARFVAEIMPRYFKQSRLSSFQRQLNLYGFTRITNGPDAGGYYHELFLSGRPALVVHMRRVGAPQGKPSTVATFKPPSSDPDFYSMTPIKGEPSDLLDRKAAPRTA